MKKLLTLFAVFALTAPVLAADGDPNVEITCDADGLVVTVSYELLAEDGYVPADDLMRGLALNITVDGGATIDAISDYATGAVPADSTQIPAGFSVFMGSIQFAADPNLVADFGDPVAPDTDPGALGGLGTAGITVEMGSLYAEGGTAPGTSGVLFKITVSGATNVTIEGESTRGGDLGEAVRESGGLLNVLSDGCEVIEDDECFPSTAEYATQYATWQALGSPDCWCASPEGSGYQCHGDADGAEEGAFVKYRIYNADLALILNENWLLKTSDWDPADPLGTQPGNLNPCADIDHKEEGAFVKYRCYNADLGRLLNNYRDKSADLPQNCPLTDAANNSYVDPTP